MFALLMLLVASFPMLLPNIAAGVLADRRSCFFFINCEPQKWFIRGKFVKPLLQCTPKINHLAEVLKNL